MKIVAKAISLCQKKINQKKYKEAEILSDQILKVDGTNLIAKYFAALSKKNLNKKEEFEKHLNELISIDSKSCKKNIFLGTACSGLGDIDKAIIFFEKAISKNKKSYKAWSNLGHQYKIKKKYELAIECLNKSYSIKKTEHAFVNLASVYIEINQIDLAIKCLKKAIKINPKSYQAYFNLGGAYFLKGEIEKAWKYYQYRFKYFNYFQDMPKEKKLIGKKIDNNKYKILFLVEQGIGDIFNFIRFIKDFKNKFSNCEIKVLIPSTYSDDLIDLLNCNFENSIIKDAQEYQYDYWCSIMDIPYYLELNKKQIEESYEPYIKPQNKCDYSSFNNIYKIGICWAGSPVNPRDKERSCHLNNFKELMAIPNSKLFSLQKDFRLRVWPYEKEPVDLSSCRDIRLVDMSPFMENWQNTASIIEGLDLIISVDTSILHLACALGKKTYGIIPYAPDWRWGLVSNKSMWYPNLTLFRQKIAGDWSSVFKEIQKEIQKES